MGKGVEKEIVMSLAFFLPSSAPLLRLRPNAWLDRGGALPAGSTGITCYGWLWQEWGVSILK